MLTKQQQIQSWINRCKTNVHAMKINQKMSDEEKLQQLRIQYNLINVIYNVLDGKTKLLGVDKNKFKKSRF